MSDEYVLEAAHLVKRYGKRSAPIAVVDDVSFQVRAGTTTAIVGESGAGKSTIGGILTGLVTMTSGSLTVCGDDRTRPATSRRSRRLRAAQVQLVPQDPYTSLDPSQSVGSALQEATNAQSRLPKGPRIDKVLSLLDSVGLEERHFPMLPRMLSGGQRQRVAIARALAAAPELIVLDEAVSALDVSVQAQVLNVLRHVQTTTGTAYVFITHDLAVVRQVAAEVVVLRNGVVVESGECDALLTSPQDPYTRLLLASTPTPGWKPSRTR